MKRALLPLALTVVAIAASVAPAIASAQSVIVLGVRSVEGDDEFTRNLTGAVRHAATQVEGWNVSDREVTFVQMALVHDCDNPNPTCLAAIAESLGVERMIYGDVRRTAAGDEFDFSVNLHLFNATAGTIEHSVADTIPGVHTDIDDLRDPARRWMRSLQGAPRTGTLVIRVNVPGATVSIDGSTVGTTDDNGALRVEDVEAGTRLVRVTAEEHTAFSSSVSVEAYAEATLEGELQAGSDGGGGLPVDLVVGSALLIAAAAFAGVWIYSGVTVFGHMNSDEWADIRDEYERSTGNLCTSSMPRTERANEICNEVATLEVLQFVFMGLTAVAGGLGLYFVIAGSGGSDDDASDAATLELLPSVGVDHAYLGARIRY